MGSTFTFDVEIEFTKEITHVEARELVKQLAETIATQAGISNVTVKQYCGICRDHIGKAISHADSQHIS
jgi:hypothetical protein